MFQPLHGMVSLQSDDTAQEFGVLFLCDLSEDCAQTTEENLSANLKGAQLLLFQILTNPS